VKKKIEVIEDELLSTETAAEIADVDARTIRRWFDAALIGGESVPMGSRRLLRVSRLSLEKYLSSLKDG
jgi:hypothetical protein